MFFKSCVFVSLLKQEPEVLGGLFGRRTPLGRAMTGPVCAMSFGVMVASQMPVPGAVLSNLKHLKFFLLNFGVRLPYQDAMVVMNDHEIFRIRGSKGILHLQLLWLAPFGKYPLVGSWFWEVFLSR